MFSKKTAIITWIRYNNFGSFLQAYGLQQVVLKLGYENYILNDNDIQPPSPLKGFRWLLGNLIQYVCQPKMRIKYDLASFKLNRLYGHFRNCNLKIDNDAVSAKKLKGLDYSQYICGSDQIWNPVEEYPLESYYYAGFTNRKKIAYAASFGVSKYPESRKQEFWVLTKDFHVISCREKIGCEIVRNVLNRDSEFVLDPTLLISCDQWRQIAEKTKGFDESTRYVLTYFLSPNKWYINYAKEFAKEHNLKLVTFYLRITSPTECDEVCIAGPSQFIWMIDHADILLTDSFHGSIFAALLHKPLIGFSRFDVQSSCSGQNRRLIDLYELMGISERFMRKKEDCVRISVLPDIDFVELERRLQPMQQKSIDFLRKSLSD